MEENSQIKCFIKNISQSYENITIYNVDGDLKHYSLATSLVVTVFILVSNTMPNRQLSLTKKLFIYLSMVDILTNLLEVVGNITVFYAKSISCIVNLAVASISNGLSCLSFELLLNISILRYLSIIRPFLRIRASHQKAVLTMELTFGVFSCIAYFLALEYLSTKSISLTQFLTGVVFLIWIGVVLTINILAYTAMYQKSKNIRKDKTTEIGMKTHDSYQINPVLNISSNKSDQRKRAAIVTLIIITVSYLVCNLPFVIFTFINAIKSYLNESYLLTLDVNPIILIMLMHYIQLLNGGLNATIYILRSKEIGEFYKSKFRQ